MKTVKADVWDDVWTADRQTAWVFLPSVEFVCVCTHGEWRCSTSLLCVTNLYLSEIHCSGSLLQETTWSPKIFLQGAQLIYNNLRSSKLQRKRAQHPNWGSDICHMVYIWLDLLSHYNVANTLKISTCKSQYLILIGSCLMCREINAFFSQNTWKVSLL